jgi:hypothetical protein
LWNDKLSEIDEKAKAWAEGPEEKEIPRPTIPYDEKLVAFIDILGVTEKVEEGGPEAAGVVTIMSQIRKYVDTECNTLITNRELHTLQIGDGYFFVADFICINEICKILSTVQWQILVYSHMLLRGALTAGGVALGKDAEYFIGPAIIKAYALERQNAIFPRIIFHNKEIEKYIRSDKIDHKYISEDQDKVKYLDFIKYYMDSRKVNANKLEKFLKKREVNKILKEYYEKYYRADKREAQKYGWLISKLSNHGVKIL